MLRSFSLLALLFLFSACADVGDGPRATVEEAEPATSNEITAEFTGTPLAIDTEQSSIDWVGAKVTGRHDGGFNDFSGTVYVDGETITGVDLMIDATSIWSDNEKLTGHLQSADFFEVETYPEASFRADTFEPITEADGPDWAEATHRVGGTLTMHGQTNRITVPAQVAMTNGTVTADANFIIDRQQWGLAYPGQPDDLIQDEVRIVLKLVAAPSDAMAEAPSES